jgi:mannose-1-phosphate guanylyltransferase
MILAAGLGTRMRPLSTLRPKPAMPVRGLPVIGYLLALLRHHGVKDVIVNAHHLSELLIETAEACRPPGMELRFSIEKQLLGTGGGIRRAAEFLRESDPALVLTGDMILDLDLGALVARHRERRDLATLALREDPRGDTFGTIGLDEEGCVRRIGKRFQLDGETAAGVFVGVRVFAARAFELLPECDAFEDLSDWLAPPLRRGARDIRGEIIPPEDCVWEPVGSASEYLAVNLHPPRLSFLDADARARSQGARLEADLVVGAGASLGEGALLERAVVWDGESVPRGLHASDGVFAGGAFHPCRDDRGVRSAAR